jgi:flavin reductase (DIM6/NTAB) family NADH-FMN oxidoreductase RutF
MDNAQYKNILKQFITGITVVTTESNGATVSSFASISLNPPIIMIALKPTSTTLIDIQKNNYFAVNILSHAQKDIAMIFSSKTENKFDGLDFTLSRFNNAILKDTLGFLECKALEFKDVGDHVVIFGEVLSSEVFLEDKSPLKYFRSKIEG